VRNWWVAIGALGGVFFTALFFIVRGMMAPSERVVYVPQPAARVAPSAPVATAEVPKIAPPKPAPAPAPVPSAEKVMKEFGLDGVFSSECGNKDLIRSAFVFSPTIRPRNYSYWWSGGRLELEEKYDVLEAALESGDTIRVEYLALMRPGYLDPLYSGLDVKMGDKYEEVYQKMRVNKIKQITARNVDSDHYFTRNGVVVFLPQPAPQVEVQKCEEDIPAGLDK